MIIRRYLQIIQDAAWFLYFSPRYANRSFLYLLFKAHLIRRTIVFCHIMSNWPHLSEIIKDLEEDNGDDLE